MTWSSSREEMRKWHCQRCRGYAESWVTGRACSVETVARSIDTIASRHGINSDELTRILSEVREESVDAFFGPPFNDGRERARRLDVLIDIVGLDRELV